MKVRFLQTLVIDSTRHESGTVAELPYHVAAHMIEHGGLIESVEKMEEVTGREKFNPVIQRTPKMIKKTVSPFEETKSVEQISETPISEG